MPTSTATAFRVPIALLLLLLLGATTADAQTIDAPGQASPVLNLSTAPLASPARRAAPVKSRTASSRTMSEDDLQCNVIDFEGVGNNGAVGTIEGDIDVTFGASWLGLVDSDAGGTGNFANEPSESTGAYFLTAAEPISFSAGVQFVELFYSAASRALPLTLTAYSEENGQGNVIAQQDGNTLGVDNEGAECEGDPNGAFCLFAELTLISDTDNIRSIVFEGAEANAFLFDDMTFCTGVPGEEPETGSVEFSVVQQAVLEGAGSIDLVLEVDEEPDTPTDVTVTLASGDPADLDGFTSATITIGGSDNPPYIVTVPITDDAVPENLETFVFRLSIEDDPDDDMTPALTVGDQDETAVIITDDDGAPVAVTIPPRDLDGDGVEDGGPRVFVVPLEGLTAGAIARAAGADSVFVFNAATGTFTVADADQTLRSGQVVLADLEAGADLTLTGSAGNGNTTYSTGGSGGRVLVPVGNPTAGTISLAGLEVEGGTLADIVLVFDSEAGAFRPVSLDGLDNDCDGSTDDELSCVALGPFEVVVLQLEPIDEDCDDDACGVSVSLGDAADSDRPLISDARFTPTDGETAVVLALRPHAPSGATSTSAPAASPGDVLALRFFVGDEGLDAFDGLEVESPFGGSLAVPGPVGTDAFFAAFAGGDLELGAGRTIPLVVRVPRPGDYEIALAAALEDVDGRPVIVEVFSGTERTALTAGAPFTFSATESDRGDAMFERRFSVRVSLGTGSSGGGAVAGEAGPQTPTVAVYPNPVAGTARVTVSDLTAETVRVAVYDVLGRQVALLHDGPASGEIRAVLEAGRLAPGAYVVRVSGGGVVEAVPVTVAR